MIGNFDSKYSKFGTSIFNASLVKNIFNFGPKLAQSPRRGRYFQKCQSSQSCSKVRIVAQPKFVIVAQKSSQTAKKFSKVPKVVQIDKK
jgi:hypothetical protein